MPVYEITSARGGLSDYEDKGIPGAFKFGSGLDIRKRTDSISCQQALVDEGLASTHSPSLSVSHSASGSASPSASVSNSPSTTNSPSASVSATKSASPSNTGTASATPSVSESATKSASPSVSESASPSATPEPPTMFDDLIRTFVKCSDGYTYGFGNTGSIYRRDADAFWKKVYDDPDGEIKGAEEMPASGGLTYLGWCTNTKIKKKLIPGAGDFSDIIVVAQNLQSGVPHTMRQVGGSTMIANGSYLAMVGYDESFTNEALDVIPGNITKTLVERNGRVITGSYHPGSPDKGINAAIDAEVPLAQVGDEGELFYADGINSISITRFPGGGIVNVGGVTNETDQVNFFEWEQTAMSWISKQSVGNMSLWGVYGAEAGKNGVYSYGRRRKNHPITLNLEYPLEVDEIGALTTVEGITLISYREGSDFGVKAVDPDYKDTGIWEGLDFRAPVKKPIGITTWSTHEIFCAPLPSGASVEFWYRVNKVGSFIQAYTVDGQSSFTYANGKKAVFRVGGEGEIFEPRLVLHPIGNNSPEVYRQRTSFS